MQQGNGASASERRLSPIPNAKPFAAGYDPRRHRNTLSPARRAFNEALEGEFIPQATGLLREMYAAGLRALQADPPDSKPAMDYMRCCGLIRKPTDDEAMALLAKKLLDGMLEEARARRIADAQAAGKPVDTGTEE